MYIPNQNSPMPETRTITDMMGQKMDVPLQPRRIVSLVPSQTELLHDLGLEAEVVGITKFLCASRGLVSEKTAYRRHQSSKNRLGSSLAARHHPGQ